MLISPQNQVLFNLIMQFLLLAAILVGVYLAKFRRKYGAHRLIIWIVFVVQAVLVLLIMRPPLIGYIELSQMGLFFQARVLVHHSTGLALFALFVVINLWFYKIVRLPFRAANLMWTSLGLWAAAISLGIYTYLQIWR